MMDSDANFKKILEVYENFMKNERLLDDYMANEPLKEEIMKLRAAILTLSYVIDDRFRKKPTID